MGYLAQMPDLRYVKLDRLFVARHGLNVVRQVQDETGKEVFDDEKITEIPSKLGELAKVYTAARPWMLNCMAGSCSTGIITGETEADRKKIDGLKVFADVCHTAGVRPCAVTVLTSKSQGMVRQEFNGRNGGEQVLIYVELLQECGFTDIVCSPEEVKLIRSDRRFRELDLNTPGIVEEGSDKGDQARVATPVGAIEAGSTRLVIGRALTTGDPAANFARIAASIAHLN